MYSFISKKKTESDIYRDIEKHGSAPDGYYWQADEPEGVGPCLGLYLVPEDGQQEALHFTIESYNGDEVTLGA